MSAIDTYTKYNLTLSSAIHRGDARLCRKAGGTSGGEVSGRWGEMSYTRDENVLIKR